MTVIKNLGYRRPTNKGGGQYSVTIPKEFIEKMEISNDDREIEMYFDENTKELIIRKREAES